MTTNKSRILAEPTVGVPLQWAVRLLSARRVLSTPRVRNRLLLSGLTWDEMAPVLGRIRGVGDWVCEWENAARQSADKGDWVRASAQAFLAQVIVSPLAPEKAVLLQFFRACYVRDREAWAKTHQISLNKITFLQGKLSAYYEIPLSDNGVPKPTVLLLPPLASGKEELAPLADPLLLAGYPVLRIDMPAQGESPGPLTPDAETLLSDVLDELNLPYVIVGGISLGAFWALRLAGRDKRVLGVLGVSPPAIVTKAQWMKQPPIIWQYLALYFGTTDRNETLACALALTLYDITPSIACPLLLYHAARDKIAQYDAPVRYHAAFAEKVPLRSIVLHDRHGCLLHLRTVIAPEFVRWCDAISAYPARSSAAINCPSL